MPIIYYNIKWSALHHIILFFTHCHINRENVKLPYGTRNVLISARLLLICSCVSDVCTDNISFNLLAMLLAVAVDLLGIPMVAVASNSLYSKITHKETQGRYDTLYSSTGVIVSGIVKLCVSVSSFVISK